MRTILGLHLFWLLAISASAQDRNFPAALGSGLPPLHSTEPHPGLNSGMPARPNRGRFPTGAGYGYGYGFGGYGYAAPYSNVPYSDVPPVVNSVVFLPPPPAPAAPPEPIHSSIQNVSSNPEQTGADTPPAFFVIVLKNGSRLTASAVWVQGNEAHFVDGDGQGHGVPLANVDRAATREVNQASHLNLRLPPPAQ